MMSKGSKEALTVLIVAHVTVLMLKGSKVVFVAYVHNTDTFNAMSKGLKDCVMLQQGTNTFLLLTFLTFQPYHPIQCMSKHVEGVESRNNFRPLRYTWHWMVWLERSKSQLPKTFFGLKIT